jgi:transcriptional regulator with XRE-family HTH domain
MASASLKNYAPYYVFVRPMGDTVCMTHDDKNGGPNHLKAWREHRGMSQSDLADAVDTTQGMIAHLESGRSAMSAKWLRKLADALKTTPGHLLEHDPSALPTDIVEIWLDATPEQRAQLIDMAKVIVRASA